MATEFYVTASATGNPSPVTGRITQIVFVSDQAVSLSLDVAANVVLRIPNPASAAAGVVIPTNIPIKLGQKVFGVGNDLLLTVTGQGA